MAHVLLIGTIETKGAEIGDLISALGRHGLGAKVVDISLGSTDLPLTGTEKVARIRSVAELASERVSSLSSAAVAALGIGGGTGSEIALGAMALLPASYPKFLITTLAFDPREALADTAVTVVPTLCDIEGLNPLLRQVFENTAAMIAGLGRADQVAGNGRPNIAVTTLGATGAAGTAVTHELTSVGFDVTVFHANGYGGAAFVRHVTEGAAAGVIDLNVHELGRIRLDGAHVPMPQRFRAADALPRVVLPGALNFLGLGAIHTLPDDYLARRHYQHSGNFTHVVLTEAEMADQALALAQELNHATGPCHLLLPMGGFSHEDRPGGAIEAPNLRNIAADVLEVEARAFSVARLDHHINSPQTAQAAVSALLERMPDVGRRTLSRHL